MKLINIIESWLKENGYHYRISNFNGYDCIVYAGVAHSVILDDEVILAGEKLMVGDPQFFEKYGATLSRLYNSAAWTADNDRTIRVCIGCEKVPYHPHPGIGAGWMVIEEENFKS